MLARLACTIAALLFAAAAFDGLAPSGGGVFDPFGLLFLGIAAFVWFGWPTINQGFERPGTWDAITSGWLGSRELDPRGSSGSV